jgi:hypothetical protein
VTESLGDVVYLEQAQQERHRQRKNTYIEGNNAFGVNAFEDASKLAATRNTPIVFTMVGFVQG